ncbi:MAG: phosphoheptose isomerase, partial [Hydrogenobaculum sp.]
GGKMKDICQYLIAVPSNDTPRIQEAHITIGHILCEIVESELFKNA